MSELQGAINQSTYLHTLIAERDARLRDLEQALAEANIRLSDCSSRADRLQSERDREAQGCMVNDPRLDHPECDEMDRLQGFGDVTDWKTLARKMERRARFYENENQMRAESLDRYNRIIGYNNDDGHHSEPGPEEMLRAIVAKGSDGKEVRSLAVGGAQLTQGGGDSTGMPLSVGRSRPDQTATNSVEEYAGRQRREALMDAFDTWIDVYVPDAPKHQFDRSDMCEAYFIGFAAKVEELTVARSEKP